MRSPLAGFTPRGRAFLAAGIAAGACGLALGQPGLLSVGAVLLILPLLSLATAARTRYQLRSARYLTPARVPAGQNATVVIRLDNVSRLPTGLVLAEDTIAYALGAPPRFVLDRIEPGGSRTLTYQLQSGHRGKYVIGPLHMRVADAFGLVRLGSSTHGQVPLVVTPAISPLPLTSLAGTWPGEGGTRASLLAAAGDDDVVPRPYRYGDELRRVHWRSTARHGELMVRREEQHWRDRATLLLDTRAAAHAGRGAASSLEFAVSTAASIGVHLTREGIDGSFVTDTGLASTPGAFEDMLLDTLAVIQPSRGASLGPGLARLPHDSSGLLVAVLGHLSGEEARQLAARHTAGPAMAVLLDIGTWTTAGPGMVDTAAAAAVLTAAGWRVAVAGAGTPLAAVWETLTARVDRRPRHAAYPRAGAGG